MSKPNHLSLPLQIDYCSISRRLNFNYPKSIHNIPWRSLQKLLHWISCSRNVTLQFLAIPISFVFTIPWKLTRVYSFGNHVLKYQFTFYHVANSCFSKSEPLGAVLAIPNSVLLTTSCSYVLSIGQTRGNEGYSPISLPLHWHISAISTPEKIFPPLLICCTEVWLSYGVLWEYP